jgi:hypothetical protein
MSEHYVEIQFLYKKWRLIHRELAYTEVLAGPWYRRWAHEFKESQAIGKEKRLFQNQNMIFKVPCHSLKKDIMALYGVHHSQIKVNFMAPDSTLLHHRKPLFPTPIPDESSQQAQSNAQPNGT